MAFWLNGIKVSGITGYNSANNNISTSAVVANADGSVVERLEFVQTALGQIGSIDWSKGDAPDVDEDGGKAMFTVGVVDRSTGLVASGSINIAAATISLKKSTAGGAFSAAGVTQPTVSKTTGQVYVDYDFDAAEWAAGDAYLLELSAITATDAGAHTSYMPKMDFLGIINEDLDVKTEVDSLYADRVGAAGDAASETGSANAKLAYLGASVRKGTGTALDANKSLVNALGNTGDAPIPAADNATAANASSIQALLGRKDDTSLGLSAAVTATDTEMRYLKAVADRTRMPSAADNVVAAGSASLGETLGRKDDAATTTVGVTATILGYLKGLLGDTARLFRTALSAPAADTIGDQLFTTAGYPFRQSIVSATGSPTSNGSGVNVTDTTRTEATNYWKGHVLHFITGQNAGLSRVIISSVSGASVTVGDTFPFAFVIGEKYVILSAINRAQATNSTEDVTSSGAIGNKNDAAATTVGVTASLLAYVKGLLGAGFAAVPAADSANNAGAGDVGGNKTDAAAYAKTATASQVAYLKAIIDSLGLVKGTLTSAASGSSFADTGLAAYATSYFRYATLIFLTGVNAMQGKILSGFTTTTGAMTMSSGFSATPSVGDTYVIVGLTQGIGSELNMVSVDSGGASWMREAIGNKADASVYAPGTTKSLMAYAKGSANLQENVATKAAAVMVNGDTLFTVAGGAILIMELESECVTANDITASTLQYRAIPTVGTAQTISGATGVLSSAAAGKSITLAGNTLAAAPSENNNGPGLAMLNPGSIRVPPGTINIVIGVGSTTGTWKHRLRYKPLDAGVTIT